MSNKDKKAARAKRARRMAHNPLAAVFKSDQITEAEKVELARQILEYQNQAALRKLSAHAVMDEAQVVHIVSKINDAFARMRNGGKNPIDWNILGMCFNVGYIRALAIDKNAEKDQPTLKGVAVAAPVLAAGMLALEAADARYSRVGNLGFTRPEIDDMEEAIGLYAQMLALSTNHQMDLARTQSAQAQAKMLAECDGISETEALFKLEMEIV